MEALNELEIQRLLRRRMKPDELLRAMIGLLLNPNKSWEEKRPVWLFLYRWGKWASVAHALIDGLDNKVRVPLDVYMEITAKMNLKPGTSSVVAMLKGLRKLSAISDVLGARGWDAFDKRFKSLRKEILKDRVQETRKAKEAMYDKFTFLKNQRLIAQAGRVLRRMMELYPEDPQLAKIKAEFDDEWARETLANHLTTLSLERWERTQTEHSAADESMLSCFLDEGSKAAEQNPAIAIDLAIAFLFMGDYARALEALAFAPPTSSSEWLEVELLVLARRHVEAMGALNELENKYAVDPETAFAVSYLRARCFEALGQKDAALEILRNIVRVRPNYRSAHALALEWAEGVDWE